MRERFKLRHLNILTEEDESKRDLATLMSDILDFKNSFFGKTKWFVKNFTRIRRIVDNVNEIDYSTIVLNENSPIKKPNSVNDISYLAMLDLQRMISQDYDGDMAEYIAKIISIATHDLNRISKYSNDSLSNKRLQEVILNQSLFDMIGLYNWILKDLETSSKGWEKLFMSVEVIDKDLESVGGASLSQFNVINTIKSNCQDFNVSEKEAWDMSYNLTMTNNYSKAYVTFLQDQIRVKKESEIEMNRRKKQY
jgi:hypothetical protein